MIKQAERSVLHKNIANFFFIRKLILYKFFLHFSKVFDPSIGNRAQQKFTGCKILNIYLN